jgi:hypothetical protein
MRVGSETCTTGMSACGYISDSGTQTPWSNGRLESMRAGRCGVQQFDDLGCQLWIARCRVLHFKQGAGKPPKVMPGFRSWMPLTSSSWLSQCAETITMALGFGSSAARRAGRAAGAGFQGEHG